MSNAIVEMSNLRNRVGTAKTPLPIEAVSQHKETDLLEDGERRLGEKDLEREPLAVRSQTCQEYENVQFYTIADFP